VHKVSIIPRGIGALGYTIQRPTEDRFLMTREELESKMAGLLGGRAARPPAHLSLEQEASPLMPVPGYTGPRNYSEHTARAIDEAVKEIVAAAFERAADVLGRNRETLEAAAELLLERETLAEAELHDFAARIASAAMPALKSAG